MGIGSVGLTEVGLISHVVEDSLTYGIVGGLDRTRRSVGLTEVGLISHVAKDRLTYGVMGRLDRTCRSVGLTEAGLISHVVKDRLAYGVVGGLDRTCRLGIWALQPIARWTWRPGCRGWAATGRSAVPPTALTTRAGASISDTGGCAG
jgi:hypothetical protein